MPEKTKKKPMIPITPREPLTKKARAAIETYAFHRCNKLPIAGLLIKFTLEAERMKRERLYLWLEGHNYRWTGFYWKQKEMVTKGAARPANNVTNQAEED